MSNDDPGWGGCLGMIFAFAIAGFLYYVLAAFVGPWIHYYDRAVSSCPTSGVATLSTHRTWGGVDWVVTCVNGDRWHVSNGGNRKPLANRSG